MSDIVSLGEIFRSCVEREIPLSWGPPGQPGDPLEIRRSVSRLISGCNELVEWESEIVSLEPPPLFEKTKTLMRGLTSQMLAELERFVLEFSKPFEQPNPAGEYEINLKFDFPDGLINELTLEAQRVARNIASHMDQWD